MHKRPKPSLLQRATAHWRRWRLESRDVSAAAHAINLRRVRTGTLLLAVLNAGSVLTFAVSREGLSPEQHTWALRILATHAAMLVLMLGAAGLAWLWRNGTTHWGARVLPLATAASVLVFATALTLIDQTVTNTISAYLNACTAVALVFLLRPLTALCLYAAGCGLVLLGLGQVPVNLAVQLNNQVNVVSASLLCLMVSVLLWRNFTQTALLQRKLTDSNTTLRQQQARLEQLATQDPLTGLLNRRAFEERAQHELWRAQREGTPLTLVMADLDHFKTINDQWGHPAGDAVLVHTAQRLAVGMRATDMVGRWGGEEFILLLPNTSGAQGVHLADVMRDAQDNATTEWAGDALHITASWGVAELHAGDTSLDALVGRADHALYQAKHQGRNRVVLAQVAGT